MKMRLFFLCLFFLQISSCNSTNRTFFYKDVVIGKGSISLDFDASGVEDMMKNKQLVYLVYFCRDSKLYPFALQTDADKFGPLDFNPIHILFNPTVPLYNFKLFNFTPYPDPNYLPFGRYTQKLLVPMNPEGKKSANLLYLFFLAPHGITPQFDPPGEYIPDASTKFACYSSTCNELSKMDHFRIKDLAFKDMSEIIKDETLYNLVIYAFTHPEYYNTTYYDTTDFKFKNSQNIYLYREYHAREEICCYAKQLYKLYEKQIGKNRKDFPCVGQSDSTQSRLSRQSDWNDSIKSIHVGQTSKTIEIRLDDSSNTAELNIHTSDGKSMTKMIDSENIEPEMKKLLEQD